MVAELVGSALLDASFSILKQNLLGKSTEDYLEELANKLAVIQTVLFDAGAKQFLDESVRQWADKVEDLCYEADGVWCSNSHISV
ncbi:hypothetical protein PanWU01x14_187050 [Parasponia andersonii]|uniref:Disease resistance N-terminal domain-containing protein n=1 Tax=Parasponia andersonii TaxID=3476 RepID=A0A2P5C3K3_PARAD|nr:hypothetical protein PanWU01x14_187050 [Parasponia andersonii]